MSGQQIMNEDILCLNAYDAYGFDLDNTLAKYKLQNVFKLIYNAITKVLVDKGYDSRIQQDLEKFKDFISKGLVLDIKRGNILKLGEKGEILKAKHGTKDITKEDLGSLYGDALKFDHSETIMKSFKKYNKFYRIFESFFDVPGLVALVRLIDIIDEQEDRHGSANNEHLYVDLWADVSEAVENCYDIKNFHKNVGGFFPGVKKSPNDYVEKCSEDIRKWLRSLKENNKCVFLVTNSFIDFSSFILETILGDDWTSYFDVCVFYSTKPGFFTKGHRFLRIGENNSEEEQVDEIQKNGFYSQGNHKDLYKLIGDITNKPDPNEMDAEGYLCSDGSVPGHENDGEPSSKRKKLEHSSLVTPEEVEYLMSKEWGPFLYHETVDDGKQVNGSYRMNTLWGSVISKYSCITVPSLEYLAGVPLSHKFEKFGPKVGNTKGFHPGIPSSLLP